MHLTGDPGNRVKKHLADLLKPSDRPGRGGGEPSVSHLTSGDTEPGMCSQLGWRTLMMCSISPFMSLQTRSAFCLPQVDFFFQVEVAVKATVLASTTTLRNWRRSAVRKPVTTSVGLRVEGTLARVGDQVVRSRRVPVGRWEGL